MNINLQELDGTLTREQRALIAQDVIALLTQRSDFVMTGGLYFYPEDSRRVPGEGQLRTERLPPCKICARAALFLASVDRFNQCDLERIGSLENEIIDRTKEEWGNDQIAIIEAAFEGWSLEDDARWFFERHGSDRREIMLAIAENIAANSGKFIP